MTAMSDPKSGEPKGGESFYAIRRTDGEPIGDFCWLGTGDAGDWTPAEEDAAYAEHKTEYEIVRMHVEPIARRTFGDPATLHKPNGVEPEYLRLLRRSVDELREIQAAEARGD